MIFLNSKFEPANDNQRHPLDTALVDLAKFGGEELQWLTSDNLTVGGPYGIFHIANGIDALTLNQQTSPSGFRLFVSEGESSAMIDLESNNGGLGKLISLVWQEHLANCLSAIQAGLGHLQIKEKAGQASLSFIVLQRPDLGIVWIHDVTLEPIQTRIPGGDRTGTAETQSGVFIPYQLGLAPIPKAFEGNRAFNTFRDFVEAIQ